MPPDLRVTWTDLWVAVLALQQTNREAALLPRNSYAAYEQLAMTGSDTAHATAEFLAEWSMGLEALEKAGQGLEEWLLTAVSFLRELDARLAAATR